MEARRVKDLASSLSGGIQLLFTDFALSSIAAKLESFYSFTVLESLLKEQSVYEVMASTDNLLPLLNFLYARRKLILHTDADYCHSPNSNINRACESVALSLSSVYQDSSIFNLLALVDKDSKIPPDAKWHEYIVSDKGSLIPVIETLTLEENNTWFKTQSGTLFWRSATGLNELSENETNRLANHCKHVKSYCSSMQMADDSGFASCKDELRKKFRFLQYPILDLTYGDKNNQQLINKICAKHTDLDGLMTILVKAGFTGVEGQKIFDCMSKATLYRLVLGSLLTVDKYDSSADVELAFRNKLRELVPAAIAYDEAKARLLFICLAHIYISYRSTAADYTSSVGYYLGSILPWSSTHTKESKLESIDVLQNYLLSDHPLHDFEEYLKVNDLHTKHWKPLTDTSYVGQQSVLSLLTNLIIETGKIIRTHHLAQVRPKG